MKTGEPVKKKSDFTFWQFTVIPSMRLTRLKLIAGEVRIRPGCEIIILSEESLFENTRHTNLQLQYAM
jgi:hypothetical protein